VVNEYAATHPHIGEFHSRHSTGSEQLSRKIRSGERL
jgi:hypothetical protein